MAKQQLIAVLGILSFLGTAALLLASCVAIAATAAIGEARLARSATAASRWLFGGRGLAVKMALGLAVLLCGYSAVLLGASFTSRELALAPGEEKYFCEIDCHLAYSIAGVTKAGALGGAAQTATAKGTFYVVSVRTRFDETTTSPRRGDGPLTPSPRALSILDDQGRTYSISDTGQEALARSLGAGTPLNQPLRPGESYTTQFVFDLPQDARNPRLLVSSPTEPRWIGLVLIGDENSLFHRKVFLRIPA